MSTEGIQYKYFGFTHSASHMYAEIHPPTATHSNTQCLMSDWYRMFVWVELEPVCAPGLQPSRCWYTHNYRDTRTHADKRTLTQSHSIRTPGHLVLHSTVRLTGAVTHSGMKVTRELRGAHLCHWRPPVCRGPSHKNTLSP